MVPVEPAVLSLLSLPADLLRVSVFGEVALVWMVVVFFFFFTLLKNKLQSAAKVGISLPLVGC